MAHLARSARSARQLHFGIGNGVLPRVAPFESGLIKPSTAFGSLPQTHHVWPGVNSLVFSKLGPCLSKQRLLRLSHSGPLRWRGAFGNLNRTPVADYLKGVLESAVRAGALWWRHIEAAGLAAVLYFARFDPASCRYGWVFSVQCRAVSLTAECGRRL